MNRSVLVSLLLFASSLTFAQQYRKSEDDNPNQRAQKVGVRIGIGTSWLKAPELRDGSPQVGVQGAIYYRMNFGKRLNLQAEFGAAYRGQNFPFSDDDPGNYYTKLGLFYLEMPLLALVALDENQKHNLMVGPVVSYLVKPSLFIRRDYYPAFTVLPIKKWEFGVSAGYLLSTKYIGLYAGMKIGLNNLAGDFANYDIARDSGNESPQKLSEVTPSLSTVKTLFNRTFELSLYF